TLPVAHGLERLFRRLARRTPTIVVGDDLRRKYEGGTAPVLATGFSLIPESELVPLEQAVAKKWSDPLRILSVGRLDREKNPLLLVEILAILRRPGTDWRLTVVGSGPLAGALTEQAARLGVGDAIDLAGSVP